MEIDPMGKMSAWRRILKWASVTVVILAAMSVLAFEFVERKIVESFSAPQFAQGIQQKAETRASYDFPYSSLNGQAHQLSELKGKVVFVNFWGTWCIRCIVEMPMIQKLYDNFRDDPSVVFVVASRLDPAWRIQLYASHYHYDLPFYMVKDSDIPQSMQFQQYPTTFIFARDGFLAEKQIGGADWSKPSVINSCDNSKSNSYCSHAPENALALRRGRRVHSE